jgi:hypothetical protein
MTQDITIKLEQPKAFKELTLKPKFCPKSIPQIYKFNWIYTTNLSGDTKTVFTGKELGKNIETPKSKIISVGDIVKYIDKDHQNHNVKARVKKVIKPLTRFQAKSSGSSHDKDEKPYYNIKFINPPTINRERKTNSNNVPHHKLKKLPNIKTYVCLKNFSSHEEYNIEIKKEIKRQMRLGFTKNLVFRPPRIFAKHSTKENVKDVDELIEPLKNQEIKIISVELMKYFDPRTHKKAKKLTIDVEIYITLKTKKILSEEELKNETLTGTMGRKTEEFFQNAKAKLKCDKRKKNIKDIISGEDVEHEVSSKEDQEKVDARREEEKGNVDESLDAAAREADYERKMQTGGADLNKWRSFIDSEDEDWDEEEWEDIQKGGADEDRETGGHGELDVIHPNDFNSQQTLHIGQRLVMRNPNHPIIQNAPGIIRRISEHMGDFCRSEGDDSSIGKLFRVVGGPSLRQIHPSQRVNIFVDVPIEHHYNYYYKLRREDNGLEFWMPATSNISYFFSSRGGPLSPHGSTVETKMAVQEGGDRFPVLQVNLFNRDGPLKLKGMDKEKEKEKDKKQKGGKIPDRNIQNIDNMVEETIGTPTMQMPMPMPMPMPNLNLPPQALFAPAQDDDDMDIESDDDAGTPRNNEDGPQFQEGQEVLWRNNADSYTILHTVAQGPDGIWVYRIGQNLTHRFAQEDELTLLPQHGGTASPWQYPGIWELIPDTSLYNNNVRLQRKYYKVLDIVWNSPPELRLIVSDNFSLYPRDEHELMIDKDDFYDLFKEVDVEELEGAQKGGEIQKGGFEDIEWGEPLNAQQFEDFLLNGVLNGAGINNQINTVDNTQHYFISRKVGNEDWVDKDFHLYNIRIDAAGHVHWFGLWDHEWDMVEGGGDGFTDGPFHAILPFLQNPEITLNDIRWRIGTRPNVQEDEEKQVDENLPEYAVGGGKIWEIHNMDENLMENILEEETRVLEEKNIESLRNSPIPAIDYIQRLDVENEINEYLNSGKIAEGDVRFLIELTNLMTKRVIIHAPELKSKEEKLWKKIFKKLLERGKPNEGNIKENEEEDHHPYMTMIHDSILKKGGFFLIKHKKSRKRKRRKKRSRGKRRKKKKNSRKKHRKKHLSRRKKH